MDIDSCTYCGRRDYATFCLPLKGQPVVINLPCRPCTNHLVPPCLPRGERIDLDLRDYGGCFRVFRKGPPL